MADPDGGSPVPLTVLFSVLACVAGGAVWVLSGLRGGGGDPAGNGMSTGILGLMAIVAGTIVGVLVLLFLLIRRPVVRGVLTGVLGVFAVLLVSLMLRVGI